MKLYNNGLKLWCLPLVMACVWSIPRFATAQEAPAASQELIQINFPKDLNLETLIEYVSERLQINILYDEAVANKRITIKSPNRVSKESLLGLLESALKMKGLALVDGDQPGWKRVVAAGNLIDIAGEFQSEIPEGGDDQHPNKAVTHLFKLVHADVKGVDAIIKPFLTKSGNTLLIETQQLLIVTDYAHNMPRIVDLVALTDKPADQVAMEFVTITHLHVNAFASQLNRILTAKQTGQAGAAVGPPRSVQIIPDERTNQLILVGAPGVVEQTLDIIGRLDIPLGLQTRVYQLKVVNPDRIDRLVRDLIGREAIDHLYRSVIDSDSGLLIVTALPDIHDEIRTLMNNLDIPVPDEQSPLRFYKLKHATAAEVIKTLSVIANDSQLQQLDITVDAPASAVDTAASVTNIPKAPELGEGADGVTEANQDGITRIDGEQRTAVRQIDRGRQTITSRKVTITSDTNTNTIIVIAEPAIQNIFERLIQMLDQRRPQVQIEVTIVTLDTTDGHSVGVEISHTENNREGKVLTFSRFGLSEIDPDSGSLSLSPGMGFNAAFVDSNIADVIIRALVSDGKAKVDSRPRILVNDHATGTIQSIVEAPFTSINASDTVATTSFVGYVAAGTNVTVTPHIAEGDYLQLEYNIALNSFSGSGSNGVPPPRQTNSVSSRITIPDGHTIIVGGLNRSDLTETKQGVPFLSDIPVLEYLFSNREKNQSNSTLFVFIRPVILRDDQFEDLKYLSDRDLDRANLPGNYPASSPLIMR